MDIKKLDLKKFLFDPTDPELVEKMSKYKEFKAPLKGSMNRQKILQYIVLMYDKNNDEVRAELPFYPQRKYEIAKAVGLARVNTPEGKMPRLVENMLIGKLPEVNTMIIRYLTLFNNPDLLMLAAYYEIYIQLSKQALAGTFDKNAIFNIEKVNSSIKELTENLFGGKDETELRQELYKSAEEQSLGIRSEEIAEVLQKTGGMLPETVTVDANPYDSDYIPGEIKFLSDK